MADINKLKPFILKWEGGFVNDKKDLGGATNKGVTLKTYKVYCEQKGKAVPTVEGYTTYIHNRDNEDYQNRTLRP